MFHIKICGITHPADALLAAECGADAIGLNFYPPSRRHVSVATAEEIVARLPRDVMRVGLFVNATDDEVCRVYDHLQLDLIQLHGDEPADFLPSLGQRPVLRAFRLGPSGTAPICQYLDDCRQLGTPPEALLIDAYQPGAYGGTGQQPDWQLLRTHRDDFGDMPLVLAGGLRPDNIAQAIEMVRPDAVDVASGVESAPGRKDPQLVERFVRAASSALAGPA